MLDRGILRASLRHLGLAAVAVVILAPGPTRADDDPAQAIGTPAAVRIEPEGAILSGRRATRQLIVTATEPDGSVRDLTRLVEWVSLDPGVAAVSGRGQVEPKANGSATIVARGG